MNGVFYFRFSFEDEVNDEVNEDGDFDVVHNTWAFAFDPNVLIALPPDAGAETGTIIDLMDSEEYENVCADFEIAYGVHDWNSAPRDGVEGIGYCTYEVSRPDAPKCVEQWRQWFVDKLGAANVSTQIYDLGARDVNDDRDAFDRVQELSKSAA